MLERKETLLLAMSLLGTAGCQQATSETMMSEPVKIMTVSDLHYLSEDLNDHGTAFEQMTVHSDAKAVEYGEQILDTFVKQAIEERPDALVITGDLTFNGETLSHRQLADKLQVIEEAGIDVWVIPGNHDLNNPLASQYLGEEILDAETLDAEEFARIYEDYGYGEVLASDPDSLSYVAELSDNAWLIAIDVNTAESPGTLKDSTLSWIQEQLEKAHAQGVQVLTASHQNLLQHNLLLVDGYVMGNHANLLRMLEDYGVPVHLSGHMHLQHIETSPEGLKEIASSSLMVSPLQYGILTLDGDEIEYNTEILEVDPEVSDYAADLIYHGIYDRALEESGDEQLADYFARLNAAYFAGLLEEKMLDEELNERWKEFPGFSSLYLGSIVQDPTNFQENRQLILESEASS